MKYHTNKYNYQYFELHSYTGGCTCNICGERIKKGTSRVGYEMHNYRWHWIKWSHLRCLNISDLQEMFRLAWDMFREAIILSYRRIFINFAPGGEKQHE